MWVGRRSRSQWRVQDKENSSKRPATMMQLNAYGVTVINVRGFITVGCFASAGISLFFFFRCPSLHPRTYYVFQSDVDSHNLASRIYTIHIRILYMCATLDLVSWRTSYPFLRRTALHFPFDQQYVLVLIGAHPRPNLIRTPNII